MIRITCFVLVGVCCVAVAVVLVVPRFGATDRTVYTHPKPNPIGGAAKPGNVVHPSNAQVEDPPNSTVQANSVNNNEERKHSGTTSNATPAARHEARACSRPEDKGADFSQMDKEDLLRRLSQSADVSDLRKAAKALGDRSITGALSLSEQEKAAITNVVQQCLLQTMSKNAKERVEARQQIERLWWAAVPALMANIERREAAAVEAVIKSLTLMRNEEIVCSLMESAQTASSADTRMVAIFALGKMTEKRESLILGRTCLNEEESSRLAEKTIRPFLQEMAKTATNTIVLGAVARAVKDLGGAIGSDLETRK
jgi:hypothetical protein